MNYGSVDRIERRRLRLRILLTCFGVAVLGAALAFFAGAAGDSRLGITGAILTLVAVIAGLCTMVMIFVQDTAAFFPFQRSLPVDRSEVGVREAETRTSARERQHWPESRRSRFVALVVLVILLFNIAVVAFLASPLARNPNAVLILGLLGGVSAIIIIGALMIPTVRARVARLLGHT
jgi:amino acid transporter